MVPHPPGQSPGQVNTSPLPHTGGLQTGLGAVGVGTGGGSHGGVPGRHAAPAGQQMSGQVGASRKHSAPRGQQSQVGRSITLQSAPGGQHLSSHAGKMSGQISPGLQQAVGHTGTPGGHNDKSSRGQHGGRHAGKLASAQSVLIGQHSSGGSQRGIPAGHAAPAGQHSSVQASHCPEAVIPQPGGHSQSSRHTNGQTIDGSGTAPQACTIPQPLPQLLVVHGITPPSPVTITSM